MYRLFSYFLVTLFLISCFKNPKENVGDLDFENDLQRYDLFGKVKKVVLMFPKKINDNSNEEKTLWQRKAQEFSKDGFLLKDENYFYGNDFTNGVYYTYGEDKELIKTFKKSVDYHSGNTYTEREERVAYDKEKRMRTFKKYLNRELQYTEMRYYDTNDLIIKKVRIDSKGKTSTFTYINQYRHDSQLIRKIAAYNFSANDTVRRCKYDTFGRLIKETDAYHHTEYTYRGGLVVEEKKYDTQKSGEQYNIKIIKYNEKHFPVYESYEMRLDFTTEETYVYEYDANGNWIKQIVTEKAWSPPHKFEKKEENIREITYWE
ncbi:hypothetical protein KORDIASMS9_04336 [Kordia sp. SMS9]|uniref:hypothetical protein n=1 Tax=Kordia sp. SMS9 TaxID=2282170 RepID=UPI000E100BE4|nr:hypothetical protein [Kordia sp. SMS9]AXG72074.1 hypothetical protein KORDIASMS9_04336 [Kordia sp. SMS9]